MWVHECKHAVTHFLYFNVQGQPKLTAHGPKLASKPKTLAPFECLMSSHTVYPLTRLPHDPIQKHAPIVYWSLVQAIKATVYSTIVLESLKHEYTGASFVRTCTVGQKLLLLKGSCSCDCMPLNASHLQHANSPPDIGQGFRSLLSPAISPSRQGTIRTIHCLLTVDG